MAEDTEATNEAPNQTMHKPSSDDALETNADKVSAVQSSDQKPEAEAEATEPVNAEKKALEELKLLLSAAVTNNEFSPPPKVATPLAEETPKPNAVPVAQDEAVDQKTVIINEAIVVDTVVPALSAVSEAVPEAPDTEKPIKEAQLSGERLEKDKMEASLAEEEREKEPTLAEEPKKEEPLAEPEEVFIWGVPLVGDERSDTVLLKFLRAREFKVKEALEMIKNTVLWRKEFGIEELVEEDLGFSELSKAVFMHGVDREGHPVCYNVFGEFQNAELYEKAFGDAEKRERFLKWRIQYLEKGIRESLDFGAGGNCEMVQVTDLKNSPWRGKHRQVMNHAVTLLQDNYPEFIAKKVFINVPWWNLAYYRMMSSVFTPRTKSKFVLAGPSKSAETLFKYIAPEQVPVAYGGLSKENDPDFTTADAVTEVTIRPTSKQSIEIPAAETCVMTWELRVLGSEVTYGAEFMPTAEEGYTVIVQKSRKLIATDEPIIKTSFKIGEPGKIVLNFENPTSKKKKLLYRFKVKSTTESAY